MSRTTESEKPEGQVLVRFTPPGKGVPRTIGETLEGLEILVSPNAVRKARVICRKYHSPYYVWLLYHHTGSKQPIHLRGFAVTSHATSDEIAQFIRLRGQPKSPTKSPRAKGRKAHQGGRRHHGSQRRYKAAAYRDHAGDKPSY